MLKIFISHCWADKVKPQFGQVYQELKGYDLWIDKTELKPGQNLNANVKKAIKDADIVIVLWSENASGSSGVQYEIEAAAQLKKTILPCAIDDHPMTSSPYLKDMLWIDLRDIKNTANLGLGWMRVRYYLTDFFLDKMAARIQHYEPAEKQKAMALLQNVRASQEQLKHQISLLRDTMQRIASGAGNRNEHNPYVANMTDRLINDLKSGNASLHETQVVEFLEYTKEVMAQYPKDDQISVKIREGLMLQKLVQLDPNEENEKLLFLKGGLSQSR